jgi:hypothetical protein
MDSNLYQWLLPLSLVLIAASLLWIGFILNRFVDTFRQAMGPTTEQRIDSIRRQTEANESLTSRRDGRQLLADFFTSEVNVAAFFEDAADAASTSETYTAFKSKLDARVATDKPAETTGWGKFKEISKAVGKKLFDKANDLVKSYLKGGGSE